MGNPPCGDIWMKSCPNAEVKDCSCPACMPKLQSTINYAFKLCGWIGLFFSFTEFLGVWLTVITVIRKIRVLTQVLFSGTINNVLKLIIGAFLSWLYRNQCDPKEKMATAIFP